MACKVTLIPTFRGTFRGYIITKFLKAAVTLCAMWKERLSVVNNAGKVPSWWNQEVKDAIWTKTLAYKTCLQNKA